jgi:hypothetical protein
MMRSVLVVMALTTTAVADTSVTDARRMIVDALAAQGGGTRLQRVRVVGSGMIMMRMSGTEIAYHLETVVDGDRSRSDVQQSNTQIPSTTVVDGTRSWRILPPCPCGGTQAGPTLTGLPADEVRALELERWRDPMFILRRAPEPVAAFEVRIGDRPHVAIELRVPSGDSVRLFIDKHTMLITRVTYDEPRAYKGEPIGATVVEYADYRDADGIKVAHAMRMTNRLMSDTLEVSSVTVDPVIEPSMFERPAAPPSTQKQPARCGAK